MVFLRLYSLLGIAGYAGLNGGLLAMGGAGAELLSATPFGAAGRRPNRGCGPRAAAGAARHNVTKPHRPRTYRDAGRERASEAASRSTCQAGASTSRRHWLWTRMESRAFSGPEEEYYLGTITRMSDWRSYSFTLNSNRRSQISIIDCNSVKFDLIAAEHQIKALQERI